MANARALDKRRKSIKNIRKITRTMELIATARFKKAMERAQAATAYTDQITKIVGRLAAQRVSMSNIRCLISGNEVKSARVLVLSSNRGLCGGYNAAMSFVRLSSHSCSSEEFDFGMFHVDASGKRGIDGLQIPRASKPIRSSASLKINPTYD